MSTVPIDTLSLIVSFLDWTCDMETFEVISSILKLTPNERRGVLWNWKSKTKFRIDVYSDRKLYCINGKLHRVYGPAVEWLNGDNEWWINGRMHRLNGPANDRKLIKEWRINGILHRTDGPAVEYPCGVQEWRINGVLHRIGGPAVIYPDGVQEWWLDGQLCRINSLFINF